jgi:hypothetical protein
LLFSTLFFPSFPAQRPTRQTSATSTQSTNRGYHAILTQSPSLFHSPVCSVTPQLLLVELRGATTARADSVGPTAVGGGSMATRRGGRSYAVVHRTRLSTSLLALGAHNTK